MARRGARAALLAAAAAPPAGAAPASDLITELPGWGGTLPSKQYSGFVNATTGSGQEVHMHYVFVESRRDPSADPLVLWQQGGPGSSGFGFGYMAEMGPFRLSADGVANASADGVPSLTPNPWSWDHDANILILEHPAGTGFSYCTKGDGTLDVCEWDDESQGEAFFLELEAWFRAFPEYENNDMYITGESYAGLLVPNLMSEIASRQNTMRLKAVALGNACTGTPGQSKEARGQCNFGGNFDLQHNVDMFYGHGMISHALRDEVYAACPSFTCGAALRACDGPRAAACQRAVDRVTDTVGAYNIYNLYDTCGSGNSSGGADASVAAHAARLRSGAGVRAGAGGGPPYQWPCGTGEATNLWMNNPRVRAAIHVPPQDFYGRAWPFNGMAYTTYTRASIDLYPMLLKKYRIMIFNGDVDACVPYNGNEDWTVALAAKLGLSAVEQWRPWTVDGVPAGYVTTYLNPAGPGNFTFLTVKGAGHMVPQYRPARAQAMFRRFLAGGPY